ncbi:MAG: hypothetical protein P1P78_13760 [Methyloprofundus sp.]|nr:hypothetical protein [Methyloprofundus sp.]
MIDYQSLINKGTTNSSNVIVYEIDESNIITTVNANWKAFAQANGAPELNDANVIGKPLLDFISGNVTKRFWINLLTHVRTDNCSYSFCYRCDAPNLKRHMKLDIAPLGTFNLRITSTLLHAKPRALQMDFKRAQQRSAHSIIRCSLCNKVVHNKQWIEADELNRGLKTTLDVTYGVCPVCHANISPS